MEQLKELQATVNRSVKEILKNHEVYLPIKGYPNYEISNKGNVRNIKLKRILKTTLETYGYYVIGLSKNNQQHLKKVHVLIAQAFLGNYENKKCVDHIDGNRANNDLMNLRFATVEENGYNRKKGTTATSSVYKGVFFSAKRRRWIAQIYVKGKNIHIGTFQTEEEAGNSDNQKALQLYGDYAKLNEIY